MKKGFLCCALFMLLLALTCCGKQDGTDSPSGDAEPSGGGKNSAGETESPFVAVSDNFHQMMLPFPFQNYECFEIDQAWIYFTRPHLIPNISTSQLYIYKNALFDTYNPEPYIITSAPFSLLAFLISSGDAYVYGQYTDNEEAEIFTLEKYDDTGTLLWRRDYTNAELGGMGSLLRNGSVTSDGRIFLHTYGENGGIVSFDADGAAEEIYLSQLTMLQGMTATDDGKVYVYGTVKGNQVFEEVGGKGEPFASPLAFQQAFSGKGNSICLRTGSGLWEYVPGESDASLLWNWNDEYVQIDGSKINKFFYAEDTYYVMTSGLSLWQFSQPVAFATISLRDRKEYPGKTTVTLARSYAADANSWMEDLVRYYNRQSKEYTIELVSYQPETPTLNALNKLEQDLLRGQGPDLMELSNVYALNWAKKGLLENLDEYYAASSAVSQDDLLLPIQESCTLDGKNVLVIPSFYIRTWCSKEAVLAEEWTIWKYLELSHERQLFPLSDPYSAFIHCTALNALDRFVDYEAKTCHFDSPEFAEFLQECAKVPSKEVPRVTWTGDFVDAEYLVMDWDVSSMSEYLSINSWYGDDVHYQGIPGWNGAEHALYAYDIFAINSSSEKKDGAWDFLEYLLSKEVQDTMDRGFPSRADSLQGYLERSGDNSRLQPEEADFEAVKDIISASVYTSILSQGNIVWKVVRDEASMYFSGDASLEQTVAKIQNRLSVYLAE